MAYILALAVGLSSIGWYLAAFLFPETHRRSDIAWSGVGLFYATVLWFCADQLRGAVLLGQLASVVLLGGLGWHVLTLRRVKTLAEQQTLPGWSRAELLAQGRQTLQAATQATTPQEIGTAIAGITQSAIATLTGQDLAEPAACPLPESPPTAISPADQDQTDAIGETPQPAPADPSRDVPPAMSDQAESAPTENGAVPTGTGSPADLRSPSEEQRIENPQASATQDPAPNGSVPNPSVPGDRAPEAPASPPPDAANPEESLPAAARPSIPAASNGSSTTSSRPNSTTPSSTVEDDWGDEDWLESSAPTDAVPAPSTTTTRRSEEVKPEVKPRQLAERDRYQSQSKLVVLKDWLGEFINSWRRPKSSQPPLVIPRRDATTSTAPAAPAQPPGAEDAAEDAETISPSSATSTAPLANSPAPSASSASSETPPAATPTLELVNPEPLPLGDRNVLAADIDIEVDAVFEASLEETSPLSARLETPIASVVPELLQAALPSKASPEPAAPGASADQQLPWEAVLESRSPEGSPTAVMPPDAETPTETPTPARSPNAPADLYAHNALSEAYAGDAIYRGDYCLEPYGEAGDLVNRPFPKSGDRPEGRGQAWVDEPLDDQLDLD